MGHRPFQTGVLGPKTKWLHLPGGTEEGSEKHGCASLGLATHRGKAAPPGERAACADQDWKTLTKIHVTWLKHWAHARGGGVLGLQARDRTLVPDPSLGGIEIIRPATSVTSQVEPEL